MTIQWMQYLSGAAAICCWLIAGVFLTFSDFVMRSLGALPPGQGIAAMQSINIRVYRSLFMVGLFAVTGASLVFIARSVVNGAPGSVMRVSAAAVYLVSVMGVTIVGNVPLNNRLAAADPETPEAAALWAHYLKTWINWNHVRTIGSALAALLMTAATIIAP